MSGFEFRPGVRDKTSCLVALGGASGTGKTYTAILLAFGLAYPHMTPEEILATIAREGRSRVAFIDSEGGRGLHYSPGPDQVPDFVETFPYEYTEIRAPYSPQNYQAAVVAADEAGFDVVIIDSMSHEYESEGGIQEMADLYEQGVLKPGKTIEDTLDRQNGWKAWEIKPVKSPGNWKEPKTLHKRMVNRMVQLRAHVIFCLRAEEKIRIVEVPQFDQRGEPIMWNGKQKTKTVVEQAGWTPICEKRFMYEMTVSFMFHPEQPGVGHPIKNLQSKFRPMFPPGELLGIKNGEALADWSRGRKKEIGRDQSGASDAPPPSPPPAAGKSTTADQWVETYLAKVRATQTRDDLRDLQMDDANMKAIEKLRTGHPALHTKILDEHQRQYAQLVVAEEERRADLAADEQQEGTDND